MKKSMYSLMLMDSVVKLVDSEAYLKNTNRSNLINQILASHFNLSTPEMQIKEVFSLLCSSIEDNNFRILENPSDYILAVKSSLNYKYRPTIRYQLELFRQAGSEIGNLTVLFRTQSQELIDVLELFFKAFIETEQMLCSYKNTDYFFDGLKFKRSIHCEGSTQPNVLSEELSRYIKMLDTLLKGYLAGDINTKGEIKRIYSAYLNKCVINI